MFLLHTGFKNSKLLELCDGECVIVVFLMRNSLKGVPLDQVLFNFRHLVIFSSLGGRF